MTVLTPFLRIPPFPGARVGPLALSRAVTRDEAMPRDALVALVDQLVSARVGGSFWGPQRKLPKGRNILLAPSTPAQASAMARRARRDRYARRCLLLGGGAPRSGIPRLADGIDPWHLLAGAERVEADADHEIALIAALLDLPLTIHGDGPFRSLDSRVRDEEALLRCVEHALVTHCEYRDPFTGGLIAPGEAVALLGRWRALIDDNRSAKAIFGIARWKRVTMDAMLWDGSGAPRHAGPGAAIRLRRGDGALAWKSRTSAAVLAMLDQRGVRVGEIEDGMIRSTGLGANCVPPFSIIVDRDGAHFDPRRPSRLEMILQDGEIGDADLARAAALRQRLIDAGISKYGRDETRAPRPDNARRRVLVTGQVEDDRAVVLGGAGLTNLALLAKARKLEPDAHIIYKPHPDVEAGHRAGRIRLANALALADEIDTTSSINALLESVDALQVITSLAGFEGLMRGVSVTTHGVPFYAGWGLTTDLGPMPGRRTRKRTLDELVAATLILYPRYLDPVTRLPCPVEVLVDRIARDEARVTSPLIALRQLQGRLNLAFSGAN